MACAQGALSRFYVEPDVAPHTFDSSSESYEFLYETVQARKRIIGGQGILGTRQERQESTRFGSYTVAGRIGMHVNPLMLDLWLPRILGATESSDTFALAESLPSFGLLFNRVTQTFEYTDCVVSKAMFRAQASPSDGDAELVELVLEIMGKTEATGTSAPSVDIATTATSTQPYVLSDGVFTFNSAAREVKQFVILIDNHVQPRFVNSLTATALCPHGRTIAVQARMPYDSGTSNLYAQARAGAAGTVAFTNSTVSTTFTFGTLQTNDESPIVRGKTEIEYIFNAIARKTGSTASLSVSSDSTV
jgi:hypothetical protein